MLAFVLVHTFQLFRADVLNFIPCVVHTLITRDVAALFASMRAVGVRAFHGSSSSFSFASFVGDTPSKSDALVCG